MDSTSSKQYNPRIAYDRYGYGVYAVWEDRSWADPAAVTYCLFYNNPNGDYYDEGSTPYTGAANINAGVTEAFGVTLRT